jgi:hypothetical protein
VTSGVTVTANSTADPEGASLIGHGESARKQTPARHGARPHELVEGRGLY